ncbi:MAG: hypothetical protein U9P10_01455 [Thermodesulfobacteriota bacterium]|nr:hypothetical protein [Thermodesulfobacteriota bacterium]
MKKVKLFLFLIVVIFVGLIIYQNREFFLTKQALSLSLGVETWHWTAPGVANVYYWGGCFFIGLILTGWMGFMSKLKSGKKIKSLNKTIDTHLETISSLKTELEAFKNDPYLEEQKPETEEPEKADFQNSESTS